MEGAVMKIQKLFVVAIITSFFLPNISADETIVIGDPGLLGEAVVNQDEPATDEAEATAEAFKLFKNDPAGVKISSWMAIGNGGLVDTNIVTGATDPGNIGVNQLGFSMDKAGEKYRLHLDLLYGRDALVFRSFNNSGNGWDNSDGFVHDDYSWALPQAFVEGAVGDWTVKGGHFLFASHTGQYSTDRFFATRTITEFLISPFTLTGVTLTGKVGEVNTTLGWAAGVNTGFDTDSSSSSVFVIGARRGLGEKLSVSYDALIGDHSGATGVPSDYYHELTASYAASDKLTVDLSHVHQSRIADDNIRVIRQSAYYTLSDTMTLGQRYEYVRVDSDQIETASVGINYQRPNWSNIILRPEIRWDDNGTDQQTEFFMDVVVTF
jgi:hypothetical protein